MPVLIACLSTGKGTWNEVNCIIESQQWDSIYLITNRFGWDNYRPVAKSHLIQINSDLDVPSICNQIKDALQGKITDWEVGLNFSSGSGKEHMAILEAVMELGLAFRIITLNGDKVETLGINRE